jgi:uncharacterized membrane protein YidH (DUF202 family)
MVLDVVENRGSTARDHLANERTFLAWVRTALGLVGLGVILERLGAGNEHAIAVVAGVGFISFGGLTREISSAVCFQSPFAGRS